VNDSNLCLASSQGSGRETSGTCVTARLTLGVLQSEAAPSTLRLQLLDDQRRAQVCVLEEVLRRRLEKHTELLGRVHRMVKWLNSLDPLSASLMSRSIDQWRGSVHNVSETARHVQSGHHIAHGSGATPCVTARQSLHQHPSAVLLILECAYDDRPEHEKDVWNLQRMAVPISLSLSNCHPEFPSHPTTVVTKSSQGLHTRTV
jgi:hypothetical protein